MLCLLHAANNNANAYLTSAEAAEVPAPEEPKPPTPPPPPPKGNPLFKKEDSSQSVVILTVFFYYSVKELHHHLLWTDYCFALFCISAMFQSQLKYCMVLWHLQSPQVLLWSCLLRTRMTPQFLSSGVSQRTLDHPAWMDTPLKSARMEVSPAPHNILACARTCSNTGINTPWQKCQLMNYFNSWF